MRILISAAMIAVLAGALHAGSWTGAYVGGQVGQGNSDATADGGEAVYGLHGGYDIDYGGLVLGTELEFEHMRLVQGNGSDIFSNIRRLKFKVGQDLGNTLAYAIVGGAQSDASTGSETGVVYGLGLMTLVSDHLSFSGEALRQVFDNFANGGDLKTDSFSVRVAFRF